ncbi:hypothetical protein PsorP6_004337 [Peronosclerospora sorghi]|uniref:Uncharacterized protein n=1 Tax=Peronosclerospora sorghi TaxID=230839 RepID=A0ACC0VQN8_9STRA|nr:hypothetical protein PsorP6_004337 [Peronosclerospora sorghi]
MRKSVVVQVHTQENVSSSEKRPANTKKSTQTLLSALKTDTMGITDTDVQKKLKELTAEVECKKLWLKSEEEAFQCGQQRLSSLQQEHARLLHNLERCNRLRKESFFIQKIIQSPPAESGDSDRGRESESESDRFSDNSSHKKRRRSREVARKERKRLRRFQREVSLRFELLESKCRESDLKVQKLVEDLRREYTDSCLFGNSFNFE